MRIVGGRFKGRSLAGPSSRTIRPTSDRLRESLFNILAHAYDDPVEGARVIDLFAGTGALGLEAISRGARFALFVDDGAEARSLVRDNVASLALGGVTKIFRRNATKLGAAPPGEAFALAFLDPPYGGDLAPPALVALRDGHWLGAGALAVIEEAADVAVAAPEGYELVDRRLYGDTQIVFLRVKE
jgi:16S rRNA (guanine966-N2)-methyltransferase